MSADTDRPPFPEPPEEGAVFAVLGDVEPKPDPVFENLAPTVAAINRINESRSLEFVGGVGDVARNATEAQYEGATEVLEDLAPPFHPIMGNEELPDIDRFLEYARRWNGGSEAVPGVCYTKTVGDVRFVFATATEDGKNFTAEELDWLETRAREYDGPVVLFVHAAPNGVYPEGKAMATTDFDRILSLPAVAVVFSGHSHLSVDEVPTAVRDDWGTQHVHAPGIERTKVGTDHVPRFRVATVTPEGRAFVETYDVAADRFEADHAVAFSPPGDGR